jgi:hypothetical protein
MIADIQRAARHQGRKRPWDVWHDGAKREHAAGRYSSPINLQVACGQCDRPRRERSCRVDYHDASIEDFTETADDRPRRSDGPSRRPWAAPTTLGRLLARLFRRKN